MGKTILMLLIMALAVITPNAVFAQQKEAGSSAMIEHPLFNAPALKIQPSSPSYDVQKTVIKNVLSRFGSPLTDTDIDEFMQQSKDLDMNPYFLPAISIVESSGCTALLSGSHNCFGWGGGYLIFPTFRDGIRTVAQGLKQNYINKGSMTVEGVGRIYSESDLWPQKVRRAMAMFEAEQRAEVSKNQLLLSSNTVK